MAITKYTVDASDNYFTSLGIFSTSKSFFRIEKADEFPASFWPGQKIQLNG